MPPRTPPHWDEGPFAANRYKYLNAKCLGADEREHLARLIVTEAATTIELSVYYGVNRKWLSKLAFKMRSHIRIRDSVGRPKYLNDTATKNVLNFLHTKKTETKYAATLEDFTKQVQLEYDKDCRSHNVMPKATVKISTTFFRKFLNETEAMTGKGQKKTKARADADPRNPYSEFIGLTALQDGMDPNLIFNYDATQYYVCEDNVIIKPERCISKDLHFLVIQRQSSA